MSNVPHIHTTPEEEIKFGKIGIVFWSAALALCILCFILDPGYWFVTLLLAVGCIGLIRVGIGMKESGERRLAEREAPIKSTNTPLTDYYRGVEIRPMPKDTKREVKTAKKPKAFYNSVPSAINELLSENPSGLKASKIAELSGLPKNEINRYLYSHKNLYHIDESYIWTKLDT